MPTDKKEKDKDAKAGEEHETIELKDVLQGEAGDNMAARNKEKDAAFRDKAQASIDAVNSTSPLANDLRELQSQGSDTKDIEKDPEFRRKAQASIDLVNSTSATATEPQESKSKSEAPPSTTKSETERVGNVAFQAFTKSVIGAAKEQLKEMVSEASEPAAYPPARASFQGGEKMNPEVLQENRNNVQAVAIPSPSPNVLVETKSMDEELESESNTINEKKAANVHSVDKAARERFNVDEEVEMGQGAPSSVNPTFESKSETPVSAEANALASGTKEIVQRAEPSDRSPERSIDTSTNSKSSMHATSSASPESTNQSRAPDIPYVAFVAKETLKTAFHNHNHPKGREKADPHDHSSLSETIQDTANMASKATAVAVKHGEEVVSQGAAEASSKAREALDMIKSQVGGAVKPSDPGVQSVEGSPENMQNTGLDLPGSTIRKVGESVAAAGQVTQQATLLVAREAMDAVEGAAYSVPKAANDAAKATLDQIDSISQLGKETAKGVIGVLGDSVTSTKDQLVESSAKMGIRALDMARPTVESTVNHVSSMKDAVAQTVQQATHSSVSAVKTAEDAVKQSAKNAVESVKHVVESAGGFAEDAANRFECVAEQEWTGTAQTLSHRFPDAPDSQLRSIVSEKLTQVSDLGAKAAQDAADARTQLAGKMQDAAHLGNAAVEKAQDFGSGALQRGAEKAQDLADNAARRASETAAAAKQLGVDAAQKAQQAGLQAAEKAKDVGNDASALGSRAVEKTWTLATNAAEVGVGTVHKAQHAAMNATEAGAQVVETTKDLVSTAAQRAHGLASGAMEAGSTAALQARSLASNAVQQAENSGSQALQKTHEASTRTFTQGSEAAQNLATTVLEAGSGALKAVNEGASAVTEKTKDGTNELAEQVRRAREVAALGGAIAFVKAKELGSNAVQSGDSALGSATSRAKDTAQQLYAGAEVSGKVTRELARPVLEQMNDGLKLAASSLGLKQEEPSKSQSQDDLRAALENRSGKAAFEAFEESETLGTPSQMSDSVTTAILESVQDSLPQTNDKLKAIPGHKFAHHVLHSIKEITGVPGEAVMGKQTSPSATAAEAMKDMGDSNAPCADEKAVSSTSAMTSVVDGVREQIASTIGIISENLTPEFAQKLQREDEKEERENQRIKAQSRLDQTFRSSPPPASNPRQGVASHVVNSSVHQMTQKQDLLSASPSSAQYIATDPKLESEVGMPDFPRSTVSSSQNASRSSEGSQKEGKDGTSKPSTWQSMKGRAKSILGMSSEESDLERDLEPQGNEVGGLNKVLILGDKDAIAPGKGSKSGEEMQEISNRIRDVKSKKSNARDMEMDKTLGVIPQGNEIGGLHKELVDQRRQRLEKAPTKRSFLGKLFGRRSKL